MSASNKLYSAKQIFELLACTDCHVCEQSCPAFLASKNAQCSPTARINLLSNKIKKEFLSKLRLSQQPEKLDENDVFLCTLCGMCEEVCPSRICLPDLWKNLRKNAFQNGLENKNLQKVNESLCKNGNVFFENNEEREAIISDTEFTSSIFKKKNVEYIYFTGCVSAFFPMAQRISQAFISILTKANISFSLLGSDEHCCGFPALATGDAKTAQMMIEKNINIIKNYDAKGIIFSCPTCYKMWAEHYCTDLELYHTTEFIYNLIKNKMIKFKESKNTIVTYHDPCDLGRGMHIFDAPRNIITAIKGLEFRELEHNREHSYCCGGGGNLEMVDKNLSAEIAALRMSEIVNTEAKIVLSSCQQCLRTITSHARKNKIPVQVLDIIQLVSKYMDV